jgi:hypothetical protein
MAKRKYDDDAPLPQKKAKLHHQVIHDSQISNAHTLHARTLHPTPLSLASSERCEKRKRTPDSQSDTLEPESKRTRGSPSPSDSPDISSEPWPSIGYIPREEEEPSPVQQWIHEMYINAMQLSAEYDSDISADDQNPLPSPEPSDGDAAERDEWEFPIVDSTHTYHSTPRNSRILSRQRPRKNDTIPTRRKRRQPPKKGKGENKRNKRLDEALSPAVETFLRSRRSTRRDANCKLWHLGDDGTACTVSRVR